MVEIHNIKTACNYYNMEGKKKKHRCSGYSSTNDGPPATTHFSRCITGLENLSF